MGYDYGAKLQIAHARHKEGATWAQAAAVVGANEATVRLWDQHGEEEWRKAEEEVFAEIKREGRGIAWQGLLKAASAKMPDIAACKELLNRCEGAVAQQIGLHGVDGKPPVGFLHMTVEELAEVARNGDGKPIGESGADGTGEAGGASSDN